MRNIDFTDSVNAFIQGDEAAFEFLYNQTYSYLRITIAKYLKKEEDIEDVLQNTYLKIYSELPNLKEPKTFWKWAGTIATNAALTEIRRQKALKNSMVDLMPPTKGSFEKEDKTVAIEALDEIAAETYYTEFNPEASMDVKETKRLLDEMLADLPEIQRQCILLWQEQRSTKEIAEQLDIPLGTVKTNIFQAKKKIKANVLELEKKGTKLYGMAPLPFFLWVFRLFDTSYTDTLPIQGDTALYERITSRISVSTASAEQTHQIDNITAQNTDFSHSTASTTPTESGAATPNKSVTNGSSAVTETPLSSTATSTAAKAGAAGVKFGIHSLSVKIIIAIVCVGVVGIGGTIGYQTIKKQRIQDELNSLPTTSQGLAEHLNLDYIGNQLYIAEDSLSVPTGCIEAYAYDLDADDQSEVITIENTEDDFSFVPTLNIYEYDKEWTVSASTPLEFSEKNWGWDKDNMSGRYGKLFIHDNGVILTDNYTIAEDDVSFIDNGEHTLFLYDGKKLTETPVDYDFYDLYENGLELCSIETQYINNNIYDSFALAHMDINSYYNESYYNHGNWFHKQESYLVNFVDYTNLKTYDFDDYSFQYPVYFDSYISFGENVMEYDITTGTEICMTGRGTSVLFGFSNSEYHPSNDIMEYKSGGMVRGLYQNVYGMYKLVWENKSDFIYYENAVLTNTRKMLEQTVLNENPLKDINTLNVNLLLLSDSNNIIPYHFHTDLEGITYPTNELSKVEKNTQEEKSQSTPSSKKADYQELYADIIKKIGDAITFNWDLEKWGEFNYSEEDTLNLYETYHRGNTYYGSASVGESITFSSDGANPDELFTKFLYAYIDIDNNGITELIFTDSTYNAENRGIYITALYTIDNNTPKLLLTSRPRSRYYLYDNAIISHEESGGAGFSTWKYYAYSNGALKLKGHILYDAMYNPDIEHPYFYTENELSDIDSESYENYEPISEKDAENIMDSYSQAIDSNIAFNSLLISNDVSSGNDSSKTTADYILPDSSTAYLDEDTVKRLSTKELYIARNEIFARHGRQFKDPELKAYFESKSWYSGTISPEEFDKTMLGSLNEYELHNIELIKKYE